MRLARIPDGADHQWSITEAVGPATAPAMRDGKPLPSLSVMTALLPADAGTGTGLFQGRGRSLGNHPDLREESAGGGAPGRRAYMWGNAIATSKGTAFSVTHNILDKSVRIVAVSRDGDGKEIQGEIRSATGAKDFELIVSRVRPTARADQGIPASDRPYEKVEIPRIALKRK